MCRINTIGFLILLLPVAAFAAVIHVPGDQSTIQAGIDAARDWDWVLVADGTYKGDGNRDIDFRGKRITVKSENGANNCVIDCDTQGRGFIFHRAEGPNSILEGFTIKNGYAADGGAIYCINASPVIRNNIFLHNSATYGSALYCDQFTHCRIENNLFTLNTANQFATIYFYLAYGSMKNNIITNNSGSGIYCRGKTSLSFLNTTITGNTGTAFHCYFAEPSITDIVITDNTGYGIYATEDSRPIVQNALIARNGKTGAVAASGLTSWIHLTNASIVDNGGHGINRNATITNGIIWGNTEGSANGQATIRYSDVQGGWPSGTNIDADPLFVTGPLGEYYLSQLAAGQNEQSPCVDAGDPASEMIEGTTRTDWYRDAGVIDMGYHYPARLSPHVVSGPGPGVTNPPMVRVFTPEENAEPLYSFNAYGPQRYGVNVTCGNVDGIGPEEIITGAGPGAVFGPHVRGFEADGTPLPGLSFLSYGTKKWGVNVATGNLVPSIGKEIITGAGPGVVFGPHVRAFQYDTDQHLVIPVQAVNFMAYSTRKWGVNVAAGDIDGDGYDEIITGPGPGIIFGPHVRGWNVDGGTAQAIPEINYFAYGLKGYGVTAGSGDVDGDGFDEIVTAPGPGEDFLAHVRGWDYDNVSIAPLPGCHFIAWQPTQASYGARVFASVDLDGDSASEIVVGVGPDPAPSAGPQVKVCGYDGSGVIDRFSLTAFPSSFTHGVNVAAGKF